MNRAARWSLFTLLFAVVAVANSQPPIRIKTGTGPKPEPIAETKLLMNGLTQPNFNGLGKLLKDTPKDPDAWGFARGQALIIAETGNLLMLRPPKAGRESQDLWMTRSADLRDAATKVALAAAGQDYLKCRAGVVELANACNRCHQSFRVQTRVTPFADDQ